MIFDLQSCQSNVAIKNDRFTIESDTSKNNSPFLDEISSLKDTKYPIELYCEINSDSSIYIDRTNAYFNEGEHLVSKHQDSNYISILSYEVGDYNYPYLKTYDTQGYLIDSIYLFI